MPFASGERLERLWSQSADRLAAVSASLDETGGTQPAHMPAHEWLRQADVLDELAHACGTVGQAADDAEAVHVGKRLVDRPELTELGGGVGDGGKGGPNSGA